MATGPIQTPRLQYLTQRTVSTDAELRLVEVEGNRRKFILPQDEPLSTDKFLTLTGTPGVPTRLTVPEGSLSFNNDNKLIYVFNGTAWIPTGGGETWAQTLQLGNTSGNFTPTITDSQQILYTGGIRIGGGNQAATVSAASDLAIGYQAAAGGGLSTAVGYQANASSAEGGNAAFGPAAVATGEDSAAFGATSTASGALSVALGPVASAYAQQSVALGNGATVAVGHIGSSAIGENAQTTAAAQIRLGDESDTVSIPGNLDVEGNSTFQGTVTVVGNFAAPVVAAPPVAAAIDGSMKVETTADRLYFRSSGTWIESGTVLSVGLGAPAEFTVSGSPVTTTGTLTLTKAAQAANLVWAGPSAGGPLAPTFRSLVAADLPAIAWSAVLAGGNTSGNNTPTITNDQEILFSTGIRIGGGGGSSAAAAASAISIGPTLSAAGVTSIAVGNLAQSPNLNSIGVGNGARGLADNAIAVGTSARADGDNAVSLGRLTTAYAPGSVALGYNANVPIAHTNSVQVGAGVTTAANQVRLGGPSFTVSVPGALELEPMSLATDNGRHFTVPTFAGPPATTPIDGTIMVDTANQLLNFRAGGAWITCPNGGSGPVEYAVAGIFTADAAQVQTGSGAFQLVQLKSTQQDTGGIVNLASDRLDFGTNETWHISVYWVGTEVGSHGGNAVLQGRLMQHNNGVNSEVGLSVQEWETHSSSFSVNISAVIRTGSTGAQYVYCEMKDSESDDVSIKPFRISASRDS